MAIAQAVRQRVLALVNLWAAWSGLSPDQGTQGPLSRPENPYLGNALWYRKPAANLASWSKDWLPIGNGYLGAMVTGGTTDDMIQLNIESFWSGGPFVNSSYTGGNPQAYKAVVLGDELSQIREAIFKSPIGETDTLAPLTYPGLNYGSYSGNGFIAVSRNTTASNSNYMRWLDLDSGLLKTAWSEGKTSFEREYFCSYPTRSCTAFIKSDRPLSDTLSYSFVPLRLLRDTSTSCVDSSTIKYRGQSIDSGMTFEFLAKVQTVPRNMVQCQMILADGKEAAVLTVKHATESWITWVGDTNYNIDAGGREHDFSFKGPDPHSSLTRILSMVKSLSYDELRQLHLHDYEEGFTSKFSLDLGASPNFAKSTKEQMEDYTREKGNAHLDLLLFNYGRYLLFSSGRGVLPANLQGVWAKDERPPWSADYHANINTQMNYWGAEITDLDVTDSLWDYMAKTWIPRGQETAGILYNTTRGWVTHNEMNIFGHTGMKDWGPWVSATWANYPASGAWMMSHVIDHLDYGSGSIEWWQEQGWPLVKGTAEFWLDNLFVDTFHDDGTMVVNPCNSPEQNPITFGCAHYQQMIWEVFNGIEKGFELSGDDDVAFLSEVRAKKARLDRGLHIGSWGQLMEWKVEKDKPTDLHRHLSHLVGLYPSYSIASYPEGGAVLDLTKSELFKAAATSLKHRGDGKGPDADAGWEKVWRAACWAQLGDGEKFYNVFKYAVDTNFGHNLFSLYDPQSSDPIFQIDANLGIPGAVMNALLQAPDTSSYDSPLVITILPALPKAWSGRGSVKGARVRGGIGISFAWRDGRPYDVVLRFDRMRAYQSREVQVVHNHKVIDWFVGEAGMVRKVEV
ncbi:hypothetical protein FRC04_006675 [Tulasnella sp. 424]|nr:hypothetical protein FRC04_006675 [Tulasnella sp. 424]